MMNLKYGITILGYCFISNAIASENENFVFDEDLTVTTPSKMAQSKHEAPASVTVITQDDIQRLGIQNIPEALRLVPGMAVGATTANNYQLSYLGSSVRATRRMQVLIDGMSVYKTGFSRVEWSSLPVHINDIERIEVTRSPSSSVYGANSFEAVINIITKHPEDNQGVQVELHAGSIDTVESYIRYGESIGNTNFYITASKRENDGYQGIDEREPDGERRDETDLDSFNIRGVTTTDSGTFDYSIGGVKGVLTLANSDSQRISPSDQYIEDYSINLKYSNELNDQHSISIQLDRFAGKHKEEWQTCYFALLFTDEMRAMSQANPDYANTILANEFPTGGSAEDDQLRNAVFARVATMSNPGALDNVCGQINENFKEARTNFAIEDTYVFNDNLRAVSGIGLTYSEIESDTFIGGDLDDTLYFMFSNIEYTFDDFVLNAGVMIENEDDRLNGTLVSPRLALNYLVSPTDTFRFIISKAYRTPDILEQSLNWNYLMTNITPALDGVTDEALFYLNTVGNPELESEKIISKEISYYGVYPTINAAIDIKYFHIDLDNIIADKLNFFNYNPDNSTTAKRSGAELEFHIFPTNYLKANLGYSYLDCESNHIFEDNTLCARHSGFVNATYLLGNDLNVSAAYYASENISGLPYHRMDFIVGKSYDKSGVEYYGQLIVRHYFEDNGFTISEDTVIQNTYDNRTHFFGELGVKF
ncbi:MAG: TonB-dependent receptor plug domain-containing protein [Methylococcales bacterium]